MRFALSLYTALALIGVIVSLLIWIGLIDLHSLINDVLASVLAGVAASYFMYLLLGKRRRSK